MSRVQLPINVSDFDAAAEFVSRLFGTGPASTSGISRRPSPHLALVDALTRLVEMEATESKEGSASVTA
jgi:hypothetical protein